MCVSFGKDSLKRDKLQKRSWGTDSGFGTLLIIEPTFAGVLQSAIRQTGSPPPHTHKHKHTDKVVKKEGIVQFRVGLVPYTTIN